MLVELIPETTTAGSGTSEREVAESSLDLEAVSIKEMILSA